MMAGIGDAQLRSGEMALRVEHVAVDFPLGRSGLTVQAVSDVSFDLRRGETLGLVGESGCGKSTLGRAIMQLPRPTRGSVHFGDQELTSLSGEQLRRARTRIQMVFQDPVSSLNPRRTAREIVTEPLRMWKRGTPSERSAKVDALLEEVGIDPARAGEARPHQFSGGQCQRISIARALVLDPALLICDEPVSALDVSVQAQVLNLLEDLKAFHDLTVLFIAHDLAVVRNVSDRVAVMYLGRLCEIGAADLVYERPAHPYTRLLLDSIPTPDPWIVPRDQPVTGEPPSPVAPPSGCRFRTRCGRADERCTSEVPTMRAIGEDRFVACHHPLVEPDGSSAGISARPTGGG